MKKDARNTAGIPGEAVLLALMVGFFFGIQLAHNLHLHLDSRSWQRVPAKVVAVVNLQKSAILKYRYHVNGRDFEGDRFTFFSIGTVHDKTEINERFQEGDIIQVFVNPRRPNQSVVERVPLCIANMWVYFFLVGLPMGFVCIYFFQRCMSSKKAH